MNKLISIPMASSMLLTNIMPTNNISTPDIIEEQNDIYADSFYKNNDWLIEHMLNVTGKTDVNELTEVDFESITELNLSKKGIKVIPKEIMYLTNLEKLDLSGNDIEEIPSELGELKNLKQLNISSNKLYSFSEVFNQLKASSLELLNISDNLLLFNLDYLKGFDLYSSEEEMTEKNQNINEENINEENMNEENINQEENEEKMCSLIIGKNPIDFVGHNKYLILNNTFNIEFELGADIAQLEEIIKPHLRFFDSETGETQRLSDNLELVLTPQDESFIVEGKFVKSGKFNIKLGIKNASLLEGVENESSIIKEINVNVIDNSITTYTGKARNTISEKFVKIISEKVDLKSESNASSGTILSLNKNQEVKVLEESGDYYKVSLDGYTGYILKSDTVDVETFLKEVTSSDAKVYISKSESSNTMGTLSKKHIIKVYAIESTWATVVYQGKIGYMKIGDLGDTVNFIGEVSAESAKIKSSPSEKGTVLGMMNKGDRVEIYEDMNNGWFKVKYTEKIGYMKSDEVKKTSKVQIKDTYTDSNSTSGSSSNSNSNSYDTTTKPKTGDFLITPIVGVGISVSGLCISRKGNKK